MNNSQALLKQACTPKDPNKIKVNGFHCSNENSEKKGVITFFIDSGYS